MCDVAYVLLLGYVERRVLADRQAAASLGVTPEDWPSFEQAQENLDQVLNAGPESADRTTDLLRRLGVL